MKLLDKLLRRSPARERGERPDVTGRLRAHKRGVRNQRYQQDYGSRGGGTVGR